MVVMMMMVMMTTLFSSGCLPHPKITNYTPVAATAFPGETFETDTKRYFLFDQQMVRMIKSSNVVAPKFNLNFPAGTTLQRKQTRQFHFDPILKLLEQHLTFGEKKKLM